MSALAGRFIDRIVGIYSNQQRRETQIPRRPSALQYTRSAPAQAPKQGHAHLRQRSLKHKIIGHQVLAAIADAVQYLTQ